MPNFILRVIRPVECMAEYVYIKEFFRFIGCLVTDYAVDGAYPGNWIKALKPEEKIKCIDLVLNYPDDPYGDICKQLGIRRIYAAFDLEQGTAAIGEKEEPTQTRSRQFLRRRFLWSLIGQVWQDDPETRKQIHDIAEVYLRNSHGELFYFLQAKRNLRVLSMGEMLRDQSTRVTKIAMHPYIHSMFSALWEAYCRMEGIPGIFAAYARSNVANKLYELTDLLYDAERPKICDVKYTFRNGEVRPCVLPGVDRILEDLQKLVDEAPEFLSVYLLTANICRSLSWKSEIEEWCYQKVWQAIQADSRHHDFIWYRSAYFYEKRKKDLEKALECYRRAVMLNSECYPARFKLGYYAAARGRFIEAEDHLRKTIYSIFHGRSANPDETGAYSNWLALSAKESQYVYKAYILLAKIALNKGQENAIREYVGRACMAASRFTDATVMRKVSCLEPEKEKAFEEFDAYHQLSTPVWSMWQALSPWTENVIQDPFVRDVVRKHLKRWHGA